MREHATLTWRLGLRHSITLGVAEVAGLGAPVVIPGGAGQTGQVRTQVILGGNADSLP